MANRIKEMRKKKGLSQKEFAKAFNEFAPNIKNVSYATISRWENGKNEPKLSTWSKLAEFFDVSVPYLQGIDFDFNSARMQSLKIDLQQIINALNHFESEKNSNKFNNAFMLSLHRLIKTYHNLTPDLTYTEKEVQATSTVFKDLSDLTKLLLMYSQRIVFSRTDHSLTTEQDQLIMKFSKDLHSSNDLLFDNYSKRFKPSKTDDSDNKLDKK